jgi:hypothetical protein
MDEAQERSRNWNGRSQFRHLSPRSNAMQPKNKEDYAARQPVSSEACELFKLADTVF